MKKYFVLFLTSLLGLLPIIPSLGSIDMIAPYYFFIAIFQIFISVSLIKINKDQITFNLIDLFYLGFLFVSLLSFIKSFNLNESLIEWIQYLTLFLTYFNLKILFSSFDNGKTILINVLCVILSVETLVIIYQFILGYSFVEGIDRVKALQGLSSNLNIGAFSILIKIPILLYLSIQVKSLWYKFLLSIILLLSTFCILIIASRGALLGLIFSLVFVLFLGIFNKSYRYKMSFFYLLIITISISFQTLLYKNKEDLISTNRMVNLVDKSSNDRLEYYNATLKLFLENPGLGVGIGNWKIVSLDKLKHNIRDYTVPYHTHNDYLQILSETGIFGFLFFLLIILYPIIYLSKRFIKARFKLDFLVFVLISLFIYFLDSNLNFPRIRPYSQMNIIYLLAFISSINKFSFLKRRISVRKFSILSLIILTPLTLAHAKFLHSYNQIYVLFADYNTSPNDLQAPYEIVQKYQENFPNITNTTIPIKVAKANYYVQNKDYNTAIELIENSTKVNPYLGFGDFLMGKIYYEKNLKDSAFKYAKKAYLKLPFNIGHIVLYQTLLYEQNNFEELNDVFDKSKKIIDKKIWKNHFFGLIKDPFKINNGFSKDDSLDIKKALDYFPKNEIFKSYDLIINGGKKKINASVVFDEFAKQSYEKGEYLKSIEFWEKASELIKNEDSYLLNMAFAYAQIEKYDKSLEKLKIIEKRNIKSNDGQFEFLTGVSLNGIKRYSLACQYLRKSKSLGYKASNLLLSKINCQSR